MERAEAFLTTYRELDEYLRRHVEGEKDASLARRVDVLAQTHPALRRYAARLKDYTQLRNALVHQRDPAGEWIAEPSEKALQDFRQVVQLIVAPPKLIPRFQNAHLRLFLAQDPLVTALSYMRAHDYSQVVVQAMEHLGLLTVEG